MAHMPGTNGCDIRLELDSGAFRPGEAVTGRVFAKAGKNIETRELYIVVKGVEYAMFQTRLKGKKGGNYDHADSIPIFEVKVPLLQEGTLEPGSYEFPFSFLLPSWAPSTFDFEGEFGKRGAETHIDYSVAARMRLREFFYMEPMADASFRVLQPVSQVPLPPLNAHAEARIKAYGLLGKGNVALTISSPCEAARAGESMELLVKVDNNTSVAVEQVTVMVDQFSVHSRGRVVVGKQLYRLPMRGLPAGAVGAEFKVPVPIDATWQPTSAGCRLTRLYYEVKAEVTMPDSCNDVSVTAPLMVQELAALSLKGKQGGEWGTAVVADATCKVRTADISADGQRKVYPVAKFTQELELDVEAE